MSLAVYNIHGGIAVTPKEIYLNAFVVGLSISKDLVSDSLEYNSIEEWDSIGHMGLISELEDAFDISFDTDDIIEFSSYTKGLEIMKKYGINI